MAARHRVVLLPGAVLPAEPRTRRCFTCSGARRCCRKGPRVYADDRPPHGFNLGIEAAGVLREADAHGFDRFHLVGYSGGGASALSSQPSMRAAPEPGAAGTGLGGERENGQEEQLMERFPLDSLAAQFMAEFTRLQLAPRIEPPAPPEGPSPPWLVKRPAGIRAFLDAFDADDLDLGALRAFSRPVYFAVGGRSNPDFFRPMAERLSAVFADFTLETFADRHHFDPPHRAEPQNVWPIRCSLLGTAAAPERPTLTGGAPSSQRSGSRTRRGLLGETTRRKAAHELSRHCRS